MQVGDTVTRYLNGDQKFMDLVITRITETEIVCGEWKFDRKTGAEIDDLLDWGPPPKWTGSYIKVQ